MYKLPIGVCNFQEMQTKGYLYIDKTQYIPIIEGDDKHLMILRPRRFGKSLFLSTLDYYYNKLHEDKFDEVFKDTYLYHHPTPLKNKYMVLNFDFSGIETDTIESTRKSFTNYIREAISTFMINYNQYFDEEDQRKIRTAEFASELITIVFEKLKQVNAREEVYLMIDEYDHFSNRIFTRGSNDFTDLIDKKGFLRPFFEVLKVATKTHIKKIFITGVLPILIDALTSGFNIMTNKSTKKKYALLFGFEEKDVTDILYNIGASAHQALVKEYYNGYIFSEDSRTQVYNADMVLYFASNFLEENKLPRHLTNQNIITDYKKIEAIVNIVNKEDEEGLITDLVINDLIKTEQLQQSFSAGFEHGQIFDKTSVISLLYYIGYLTIDSTDLTGINLKIPNYIMKSIYYEYIKYLLERKSQYKVDADIIEQTVRDLAHGKIDSYIHITELFLENLSNRDYQNFDEKYIKLSMISLLSPSKMYKIISEKEEKGRYVDLSLETINKDIKNYYIELKYVKVSNNKSEIQSRIEEGIAQLRRIKEQKERINTDYYLIIFQKYKCIYVNKV